MTLPQWIRWVRWKLRRLWVHTLHGPAKLRRSPIVFGNSFPKSGTHLLTQVIYTLPKISPSVIQGMGPALTFERRSGRQRATQEIVRDLAPLQPGDISFGHVIATPATTQVLCKENVAHIFLFRDPRDVVVSHALYVTDKADDHVHHAHYKSALTTPEARIQTSILGRPDLEIPFPPIGERFNLYQGWLECPWVCQLQFEDFITARQETIQGMVSYLQERGLEISVTPTQALEILSAAINPQRSPTFRQGKIGGWRDHFTAEHKHTFKEVAGDLLIQLGYEQDFNW